LNLNWLCGWWLTALLTLWVDSPIQAQQPAISPYQVRVVTIDGARYRGVLEEVTDSALYITRTGWVSLNDIRKVAIRRKKKTPALVSGAILGGLLTAFVSNQSLQRRQARSPVTYGLTLTFAAAGGAAGGLLVGSLVSSITNKVIRPPKLANPTVYLYRQLQPYSTQYQQDIINRLPNSQ
jgi:hypothetical protein